MGELNNSTHGLCYYNKQLPNFLSLLPYPHTENNNIKAKGISENEETHVEVLSTAQEISKDSININ